MRKIFFIALFTLIFYNVNCQEKTIKTILSENSKVYIDTIPFAEVVENLIKFDTIIVLDYINQFYKIKCASGKVGYIYEFKIFTNKETEKLKSKATKFNIDDISICENFIYNKDDFTDEITFNSPYNNIVIYKIKKKNKTNYFLALHSKGFTLSLNEKNIMILFNDKTKLVKYSKIDCNIDSEGNYKYSAFIPLTLNDLNILKSKEIAKFRLYIYDTDISSDMSHLFKKYVNCIIKK